MCAEVTRLCLIPNSEFDLSLLTSAATFFWPAGLQIASSRLRFGVRQSVFKNGSRRRKQADFGAKTHPPCYLGYALATIL